MSSFRDDFHRSFKASIPVLLGYVTIGFGFGLLAVNSGYPAWLALFMSIFVYAGAAQYIGIGLFVAGASIPEIVLITLVANIRHAAYGLSLISRYARHPGFRPYLVFALTDETFALISSQDSKDKDRGNFLLFVSALNQLYWVGGTCLGAFAGSLATERIKGLDFALTAMFIVLAVEQALKLRRAFPFVLAAFSTLGAKFLLGDRFAIIAGLAAALLAAFFLEHLSKKAGGDHA
jgi:4-azaleucine resistance transporter AzlC